MFSDISCLEEVPVPESLQPTVFIQNTLIKLQHEQCIDKFSMILLNNDIYRTPQIMDKLAEEMVLLTQIRHNKVDLIVRLCNNLFSEFYFNENLRSRLLLRIFRESSFYLLLKLYQNEVFDKGEIIELINSQKRADFAVYFAPEFGVLDLAGMRRPCWVRKVLKHLDEFKANEWSLFKQYREIGWMPDSIAVAIKRDDVDAFVDITANPDYYSKGYIEASPLEPFRVPRVTTYIAFAATFGAIKIFKYLFNSDAEITESVMHCAIAGGNHEIVRICSRIMISGFEAAVEYRQNDIMDWLLQSKMCYLSSSNCLDWNNVLAAIYLLDRSETNEFLSSAVKEILEGHALAMPDIVSTASNF